MLIYGIYLIKHHLYENIGWVSSLIVHHFLMHNIGWNPSDQTSFICRSWLIFIPVSPMDSGKESRDLMAWIPLSFHGIRFGVWFTTFSCVDIFTSLLLNVSTIWEVNQYQNLKTKNIIQPIMKLSRPCQIFKIQHPRVKVMIMWIPFKYCS